jgi:hypothetical protein
MAIIANTYKTYETKGIREQLSDVISNISPTDTPFTSNAGRGEKLTNTFYEWQQDSLASADTTNAQIEGDDHGAFAQTAPTLRIGNYAQISQKDLILSDTQEEVNKAGRKSELAYQIAKRGKELKRDIEAICLANQAAVAGNATTARKTAALLAYIRTNTDFANDGDGAGGGTDGANPPALTSGAPTTARTDNTNTRAFTETILKTIISKGYTSGMNVDGATLMVGPAQKAVVSGFAGLATKTYQMTAAKTAAIIGAADVYVSDFGVITVVPNRFQRNRDAFLLDFDMVKIRELRPYQVKDLAKTGDATKKLMIREWGLEVTNEAGLALAADLT